MSNPITKVYVGGAQGGRGPVGPASDTVPFLATATGTEFDEDPDTVLVRQYSSGSAPVSARYDKTTQPPAHALKFTSLANNVYAIAEQVLDAAHGGAVYDGVTDDSAALSRVIAAAVELEHTGINLTGPAMYLAQDVDRQGLDIRGLNTVITYASGKAMTNPGKTEGVLELSAGDIARRTDQPFELAPWPEPGRTKLIWGDIFSKAKGGDEDGGNTGTGTMSTVTAVGTPAQGYWTITLTSSTAFTVKKPDGTTDGTGTVGTQYTSGSGNGIKFTITAGGTAFVAGDAFTANIGQRILIVTKAGVCHELVYGNVQAPSVPSNSAGGTWESWRAGMTQRVANAFCWRGYTSAHETGTNFSDGTISDSVVIPNDSTSGRISNASMAYRQSSTVGQRVAWYNVYADRNGFIPCAFRRTTASCTKIAIRVDGEIVAYANANRALTPAGTAATGNNGHGALSGVALNSAGAAYTGAWRVVNTGTGTSGAFTVYRPDGTTDGTGTNGTLYNGGVRFTNTGNATVGTTSYIFVNNRMDAPGTNTGNPTIEAFSCDTGAVAGRWSVVWSSATAFSVIKPDGTTDGTGTIGNAYDGGINLTMTAGANAPVSGDVQWVNVPDTTDGFFTVLVPATPNVPHTVSFEHTATGNSMYYIGCSFYSIFDLPDGLTGFDTVAAYSTGTPWIKSRGSTDYAFHHATTQTWAGRYHGGETAVVPAIMALDGQAVTIAFGTVLTGKSFIWKQKVRIEWNDVRTTDYFILNALEVLGDNSVGCMFDVSGSALLDIQYPFMLTTNDDIMMVAAPNAQDLTAAVDGAGIKMVPTTGTIQYHDTNLTTVIGQFSNPGNFDAPAWGGAPSIFYSDRNYMKIYSNWKRGADGRVTEFRSCNLRHFR